MTTRLRTLAAATAAAALLVAGIVPGTLSTDDARQPARKLASDAVAVAATVKPTVVVISVDGLNQDAFAQLPKQDTQWFDVLRSGSSTTSARTAVEQTDTLPNHAGMITGRRILSTAGHNVDFNTDKPSSWIARENGGRYIPSIFDVAHDRGMSTALLTSKDKLKFLERSYNRIHGARDRVGANNGRDKIDAFYYSTPDNVTQGLVRGLTSTQRRNLYFWHITLPDAAGHDHGFMSPEYLASVARSNAMLGELVTALRSSPTLLASTSVILTADHGGLGSSHRDPTKAHNFRVPFYTWGRGVSTGVRLYAQNPTRYYPGTRRVGYAGAQPIRNMDAANTALRLLGLPALRGATPALRTTWN